MAKGEGVFDWQKVPDRAEHKKDLPKMNARITFFK
jgi:hypothetical protein